jgi:hypothetical protein
VHCPGCDWILCSEVPRFASISKKAKCPYRTILYFSAASSEQLPARRHPTDFKGKKSSRVACGNYSKGIEFNGCPVRQRRTVLPKRYSGARLMFRALASGRVHQPHYVRPCQATNSDLHSQHLHHSSTHHTLLFFQLSRPTWHRRASLMEHGFYAQRVDALLGPMY